jgi:maltose O-acetyltransferase
VLARKGITYALGLATAPLWLADVDRVGARVRTIGRPRIVNRGQMELGDDVILRSILVPVELTTEVGAELIIGAGTFLNYGVSIGSAGSIRLGARVNVGPYTMIIDTEFHDAYDRTRVPPPRPVVIDDDVFLGAKCSVLPGVHIGRAAIVGTGAVVTRDVAPFSVVAGVPAREIKRLDPSRFAGG